MAIGTVTIGETPCCGVIERTYEALPDSSSETGMWHTPGAIPSRSMNDYTGGPYAPTFSHIQGVFDRGICPHCNKRFRAPTPVEDQAEYARQKARLR